MSTKVDKERTPLGELVLTGKMTPNINFEIANNIFQYNIIILTKRKLSFKEINHSNIRIRIKNKTVSYRGDTVLLSIFLKLVYLFHSSLVLLHTF